MQSKATEGHFSATVKATGDGGSFEAVMSMPTLDRDGEIVDTNAFAPLPEHITIDVDHGMSVEKTIGSGTPFYDGEALKIKGTFASTPLGQLTRTLVKEGHVRNMSVAYRAANYETGEDGVPHLKSAELLNAAIVPIPANREALITAAKSLYAVGESGPELVVNVDGLKLGVRNSANDTARIQAAHDLFVDLGADCGEKHADVAAGIVDGLADWARKNPPPPIEVKSPTTDPEEAAAVAAAEPPAEVVIASALAEAALAL